jgi:tripartite-type tricarboxylate transporter receptor subunit TctC
MAALPLGALPGLAQAQSLETAKILCGFSPGGTADAMSRRIADKLRGGYAGTVIVDSKPGAGGQIAISLLKDSPADGSTLLLTPSSMLSIYPFVYKTLPYKPLEDVQPVSLAGNFNHALGVGPAVPATVKSVSDFLTWSRANKLNGNYGSPGAGSMPHLIMAFLGKLTNSDLRHVPYRGSAPGVQDMLGGQISAMSAPVGEFLPHMKTGKIRLLGVSGPTRSQFIADVPTYRQQGYPITVREWFGVFLPGNAKPETVRRAAAYLQPALAHSDFVSAMANLGIEAQSSSPSSLAERLRADADEWKRLIKQIGFTPES